jgi:hypothetical protein
MATVDLLSKVKMNLILEHSQDDDLISSFISAAVSYAESYQHLEANYYQTHAIPQQQNKQSLCFQAISMKVEMDQLEVSLQTTQMQQNKHGKQ